MFKGRFFKELNTYYVFSDGKMTILYPDGNYSVLSIGDSLSYGGKFTQEMFKEGLSRCVGTAEFSLDKISCAWRKEDVA